MAKRYSLEGKLVVLVAAVVSLLVENTQQVPLPSQSDFSFVSVTANILTTDQTYVTNTAESAVTRLAKGLPTPDGDLFTVTSYNINQPNSIRLFSRTGTLNLLYNSAWQGLASTILKTQGGSTYLISCVWYWSAGIGIFVQSLTTSGSNWATSGAMLSQTTFRIVRVLDLPGTAYFFGSSLSLVNKYDVTTVTSVMTSNTSPGGGGDYPLCLFYSQSTDTVFAWWISTSTLAVFSSSTLVESRRRSMPTTAFLVSGHHRFIQDNLQDSRVIWMYVPTTGLSTLNWVDVSPAATVSVSTGFSGFKDGFICNLGTLAFVAVIPDSTHASTTAAFQGVFLLFSKADISSFSIITVPPALDFQPKFASTLTSEEIVGTTKRQYMGFVHGTNFNFQTYYFLIDSCALSGYTACTSCPATYWLANPTQYGAPGPCKLPAEFPAGTGADTATSTYRDCAAKNSGCLACLANYQVCTSCDATASKVLLSGTCVDVNSLAKTMGVDLADNSAKPCLKSTCTDCRKDYTQCFGCNETAGELQAPDGTCATKIEIKPGFGIDNATNTLRPCNLTTCAICTDDYTICKFCTPGAVPSADGKSCDQPPKDVDPLPVIARWNPVEKVLLVKFPFQVSFNPSLEAVIKTATIFDKLAGREFSVEALGGTVTKLDDGFQIQLSEQADLLSAQLNLPASEQYAIFDTKTKMAFVKYPIIIDGISIIKRAAVTVAVSDSVAAVGNSRAFVTAAIVSFNPILSILLDMMFAELEILKLYDGPAMAYPDFILKAQYLDGLIPLQYDNFFESGKADTECLIDQRLSANGVTCLFLDNYGKNVIALFGYLGLALLLYIMIRVARSLCSKGNCLLRILEYVYFTFGFVMFHAKMEGEKFNHIFFITVGLHFRSLSLESPYNIGYMGLAYGYYWTVGVLVALMASQVGSALRSPALAKMLEEHKKNFIKLLGVEEDSKRDDVLNFVQSIERQLPEIRPQNRRRAAREGSVATATNSPQKNGGILEWDVAPIPKESIHARPISLDVSYEELPVAGETIHLRKLAIDERWESRIHTPHASSIGLRHELLQPQPRHRALYSISIRDIHTNGTSEASDPTPITSYLQDKAKPSPTSVGALLLGKALPSEDKEVKPEVYSFQVDEEDLDHLRVRKFDTKSKVLIKQFKLRLADLRDIPAFKNAPRIEYKPLKIEAKEVVALDTHEWTHLSFFVEDLTLSSNKLYLYLGFAGLIRLHLISLVLVKFMGDAQTQLLIGIAIDTLFLIFSVKAYCRVSTADLIYEVTTQSLVLLYLVLKFLSTTDWLSEEHKQKRLGLLMAGTICMICLTSVLFVLYTVLDVIFGAIGAVWSKLRKSSPSPSSSSGPSYV